MPHVSYILTTPYYSRAAVDNNSNNNDDNTNDTTTNDHITNVNWVNIYRYNNAYEIWHITFY